MTPRLHELSYRPSMLIVNLIKAAITGLTQIPGVRGFQQLFRLICDLFIRALHLALRSLANFNIQQVVNAMVHLYFQNGNVVRPATIPQFEFEFVDDDVSSRTEFLSLHVQQVNTHPLGPRMNPMEGRVIMILQYMSQLHEQAERPEENRIVQNAANMAIRVFTAFLTLIEQVRQGRNSTELIIIRPVRITEDDVEAMDREMSPESTSEAAEEQSDDEINHHNLLALRTSEVDKLYGSASTASIAPRIQHGSTGTQSTPATSQTHSGPSTSAMSPLNSATLGAGAQGDVLTAAVQILQTGAESTPAEQPAERQPTTGCGTTQTQHAPTILGFPKQLTLDTREMAEITYQAHWQAMVLRIQHATTDTQSTPATSEMSPSNPATLGAGAQGDVLTAPAESEPAIDGGTQPASTFPGYPQAPIPAGTYQSPVATNQPAFINQVPINIPPQPKPTPTKAPTTPPTLGPWRNYPLAIPFRQISQEDEAVLEEEFQRTGGSVPFERVVQIAAARGLYANEVFHWFDAKIEIRRKKEMERMKNYSIPRKR